MKKYTITIIVILSIFLFSCTKNTQVNITYQSSGAISTYKLYYQDANGQVQQTTVTPQSTKDKWVYSFNGEQGDIVYFSGNYKDPNSSLTMMIKVDGKIYKQASNEGDTLRFLTVSGVVPIK